jgi:hypothetical protein
MTVDGVVRAGRREWVALTVLRPADAVGSRQSLADTLTAGGQVADSADG